jgi:SAM-dependent methyltransferase
VNLALLRRKVRASLVNDGLVATLGKLVARLRMQQVDDFDRLYGTDTSGIVDLWQLEIDSANAALGVRYQTIEENQLISAIEFLNIKAGDYTFIDLGCGKGRTLLIAAKLGFLNVIGVEFARELAAIARSNLALRRVANGWVQHQDAADYEFPPGKLVIYLYNPFASSVLERVISHLPAGWRGYIIYARPECSALFDAQPFLKRVPTPPHSPAVWEA